MSKTQNCPDCAVAVGEQHDDGCDVARCLFDGGQRLSCDGEDHDCGRDAWSGEWPGVAECREFGWWAVFVPYKGFLSCAPDAEGAREDLNRLSSGEATWSREQARWVLR